MRAACRGEARAIGDRARASMVPTPRLERGTPEIHNLVL